MAQDVGVISSGSQDKDCGDALKYAVDIISLAKKFRRHTHDYTTLKSSLLAWFRSEPSPGIKFTYAIRDLTLRIPQGSSVGIIGRNGSGKSTLLKLITGIYKPDTGRIRVNGRVAALIELGAGFHPDFTGRENLYLAGVMLGLSREEIDKRFSTIVEFAELEDVIDDAVRTYSSGMFMRLGFSLAVHTDPDILLVDEVLAVGDAGFVNKCREKISELRRNKKTFVLVTHDLEAIERWCDEALWLHEGEVRDRGDPRRVIDHYRQFIERGEEEELFENTVPLTQAENSEVRSIVQSSVNPGSNMETKRWGSREIEIVGVKLCDSNGHEKLLYHPEDSLSVEIEYVVHEENIDTVVFGIGIKRSDGLAIYGSNTDIEDVKLPELGGGGTVRYSIARLGLLDGIYHLDVAVHKRDGYPYHYLQNALKFSVRSALKQLGVFIPPHSWSIESSSTARKVSGA